MGKALCATKACRKEKRKTGREGILRGTTAGVQWRRVWRRGGSGKPFVMADHAQVFKREVRDR